MRVAVCFAPMIPASWAIVRTSPFLVGMLGCVFVEEGMIRLKAVGERVTVPIAVAERRVFSLGVTETIEALPVKGSMCVS